MSPSTQGLVRGIHWRITKSVSIQPLEIQLKLLVPKCTSISALSVVLWQAPFITFAGSGICEVAITELDIRQAPGVNDSTTVVKACLNAPQCIGIASWVFLMRLINSSVTPRVYVLAYNPWVRDVLALSPLQQRQVHLPYTYSEPVFAEPGDTLCLSAWIYIRVTPLIDSNVSGLQAPKF